MNKTQNNVNNTQNKVNKVQNSIIVLNKRTS